MINQQHLRLGFMSSGGYFLSTFLFGVMFGIAAASADITSWQALLMTTAVFSATAQFATLEFWQSPLPITAIALSVALVSSRYILLGLSLTHHLDGHSWGKRLLSLFLLSDPSVITALKQDKQVDKLSYMLGYSLSLLFSWVLATAVGLGLANYIATADLGSLRFAGPLVMATMMMLAVKGQPGHLLPWIVSGLTALALTELKLAAILVLLLSVAAGVLAALWKNRRQHGHSQ